MTLALVKPEALPRLDPDLPYERDLEAQRLVREYPDGIDNVRLGECFGVSRERIRQVLEKALGRLRTRAEAAGITAEDLAAVLAQRGRGSEHEHPRATSYAETPQLICYRMGREAALPEAFYSERGLRAEAALVEAERRIARLAELVRRAECHARGEDPGAVVIELPAARQAPTVEEGVEMEVRRYDYKGEALTISEIAQREGVTVEAIRARIKKGWIPGSTEPGPVARGTLIASSEAPPKKLRPARKAKSAPKPEPVVEEDVEEDAAPEPPKAAAVVEEPAIVTWLRFGGHTVLRWMEVPGGIAVVVEARP